MWIKGYTDCLILLSLKLYNTKVTKTLKGIENINNSHGHETYFSTFYILNSVWFLLAFLNILSLFDITLICFGIL